MATPPTPPTPTPPPPRAAGVFLAIGAIGGAAIGGHYNQPSLGLVAGLAAGTILAVALWVIDRR